MQYIINKEYTMVVVGRSNVGKSSLFRALIGCITYDEFSSLDTSEERRRNSTKSFMPIVSPVEHTTRDFIDYACSINGMACRIIDTAGFADEGKKISKEKNNHVTDKEDNIKILSQLAWAKTKKIISYADLILFVVDAESGLHLSDKDWAIKIRCLSKPTSKIVCLVNKADNDKIGMKCGEFGELGFADWRLMSAIHKIGIKDLFLDIKLYIEQKQKMDISDNHSESYYDIEDDQLTGENIQVMDAIKHEDIVTDELLELGKEAGSLIYQEDNEIGQDDPAIVSLLKKATLPTKINIVLYGKQNAGKSTLLNALVGAERAIVSDIPGTTIDHITASVAYEEYILQIVDTAGRSKYCGSENEVYAQFRADQLIAHEADIIVLAIDARQELDILLDNAYKISQYTRRMAQCIEQLDKPMILCFTKMDLLSKQDQQYLLKCFFDSWAQMEHVSYVFISAKNKRLSHLLATSKKLYELSFTKISTKKLNNYLRSLAVNDSHYTKIKFIVQKAANPIIFSAFVNQRTIVPEEQLKHLRKKIRGNFDLHGVPIKILVNKYSY